MSDQEIPQVDAAEQAQAVGEPVGPVATPTDDPEVPEADALEQAQSVPLDPEEEAR
jgi:hypothetical protein